HLVRADDERAGKPRAYGARLGFGQAQRGRRRHLAGQGRLVDVGRGDLEREPESRQQGPPVARGRSQYQRAAVPHCFYWPFFDTRGFSGYYLTFALPAETTR